MKAVYVPGVVVAVGARHDLGPCGAHDVHVEVLAYRGVRVLHVADVGLQRPEDTAPFGRRLRGAHRLRRRVVVGRLVGIEHRRQHAQVVRVVAHAVKVQRRVELQGETGRVVDGIALGELVRVVRVGPRAEDEGVVRVPGVDVQVAEERRALGDRSGVHGRLDRCRRGGVAWGVLLGWRLFRRRFAPRRQQPAQKQQCKPPHDPPSPQMAAPECVGCGRGRASAWTVRVRERHGRCYHRQRNRTYDSRPLISCTKPSKPGRRLYRCGPSRPLGSGGGSSSVALLAPTETVASPPKTSGKL